MPYMVKIAQLMIPQPPWGRKYRYLLTTGQCAVWDYLNTTGQGDGGKQTPEQRSIITLS